MGDRQNHEWERGLHDDEPDYFNIGIAVVLICSAVFWLGWAFGDDGAQGRIKRECDAQGFTRFASETYRCGRGVVDGQ